MATFLMIQIQPAPYAGTAYLNGAAKANGHRFILFLGSDPEAVCAAVNRHNPDLIGFSCMSTFHRQILALARSLKQTFAIPIILGGPHPTLFPVVIQDPSIDLICRGEGEFAFIELLNAIDQKSDYTHIENLWVKSNGTIYRNELRQLADPLDQIPLIDWSCYANTPVAHASPTVFLIRGCPYSCTYCFNGSMRALYQGKGKYVRHFSVDRSICEITQALQVFAHNPVLFTSDSFGIDLAWTEELFQKYSTLTDLPFVLLVRPELATENCIALLAKYKCLSVAIGVESGAERVRKEIMHRHYPNRLLLEVADRLHAHKIKFRTYNMLGLPTESEAEMWETIGINIQMKTDFPRATIFTPMPNTKIVDIAKEFGYLDLEFSFDSLPDSVFKGSILNKIDNDRVVNILYFFQTLIRFPRLQGAIQRLIRLKPNFVFRFWFYCVYAYLHRKSEGRAWIPYLKYLISNRKTI